MESDVKEVWAIFMKNVGNFKATMLFGQGKNNEKATDTPSLYARLPIKPFIVANMLTALPPTPPFSSFFVLSTLFSSNCTNSTFGFCARW